MDMNFTIPVNEAFEASAADPACGCPLCALARKLEADELELILGASMMEPDIRIRTNRQGFCRTHYDLMFVRKNRLGMALTLESHLAELEQDIRDGGIGGGQGNKPLRRIGELEADCYICRRVNANFEKMVDTSGRPMKTFPKSSAHSLCSVCRTTGCFWRQGRSDWERKRTRSSPPPAQRWSAIT